MFVSFGRFLVAVTCCLAIGIGSATTARAQAPAAAAPAAPQVGFQDGFFIQTANGDDRLLIGFNVQIDGRFSLNDPPATIDTFTVRKFRPTFSGRVAKYFDYKFMPDLGNGAVSVQDAYFDIRFSPKFRVRAGKDKGPIGLRRPHGDVAADRKRDPVPRPARVLRSAVA